MPIRCDDLDALVPAYLDGELTGLELDDVEHHVGVCGDCRARTDAERDEHASLRALLRAPAAPATLRRDVLAGLDRADRAAQGGVRRWALPAAASLAAAAALAVFTLDAVRPAATSHGELSVAAVQHEAVAARLRSGAPLVATSSQSEVARSVGEYLQVPVTAPRFAASATNLRGWQPTRLAGRVAAKLVYEVTPTRGGQGYRVDVDIVDARNLALDARDQIQMDGTRLWFFRTQGMNTVAIRDDAGVAYVVTSDMPRGQLLDLVLDSDMLAKVNQRIFGR